MTNTGPPPTRVDLLIRGGTIFDGDDLAGSIGDVGVIGDRIVFVGPAPPAVTADREIDASGMIVAPGFIDAHTHADTYVFSSDARLRLNRPFTSQGVTTAVIGNDGFGSYDIARQARILEAAPPGTNVAMFVGFEAVRRSQLDGASTSPTPTQLGAMKALVHNAMSEGAIGFSAGLYYTPQCFATTHEVTELAKVAAAHGGIYDSHIRDEQSPRGFTAAVQEALQIGRDAGVPVHIAHIKALGADVAGTSGRIIEMIETARASGQTVTADQYPWLTSSTALSMLFPSWADRMAIDSAIEHEPTTATRDDLRHRVSEKIRSRNGAEAILFVNTDARYANRTLADIAAEQHRDPADVAIAILRETDPWIINRCQTEEDLRAFMRCSWVGTSSDSSPGHPRTVASFARKYREYVVNQQVLSTGEFVRSSTSQNADAFGLVDRGRLQPGRFADIVVFDPQRYRPNATYTDPTALSEGIVATVVNGVVTIEHDELTFLTAGRPLLRGTQGHFTAPGSP